MMGRHAGENYRRRDVQELPSGMEGTAVRDIERRKVRDIYVYM